MIPDLLLVLPILLKWVPALANIVHLALAGGLHPDEAAWCDHIPGLEEVCIALRDQEMAATAAVRTILGDPNNPHHLDLAMAELRAAQVRRGF